MKISELVDIDGFREFCESFSALTGLVTAILDLEGNVIVATGWQDICTRFHRVHPLTAQRCRESDTILAGQRQEKDLYAIYKCKNGLIDVAAPININGQHIGNFFTGQFFLQAPDINFFIEQAIEFKFDRVAYLEALSRVPIINESYLRTAMRFFNKFANLIGEMGNAKKRLEEANIALQINRNILEEQVEERTAELTAANKMMQVEITDRKRMEAALKESERKLSDIIDFLPDATFAIDLSGKAIAWNRAVEAMTGVKAKDILGKGNYEYTMAFYGIRRPMLIDLIFRSNEEIEKKYIFIKREGNVLLAEADVPLRGVVPHTLSGKTGPLYDDNGNIVGAIESIRDITELKRAKEALQKAHDELEIRVKERTSQLEALNAELESFSYSISHDLRAPLRAIDGFSMMILKKQGTNFDKDTQHKFNVIRHNTEIMGQLIDGLLELSRLGRKCMNMSIIYMDNIINEVWEEIEIINQERKISLSIKAMPPGFGDVQLIRQVYSNLLSNAVKFTKNRDVAVIEAGGYTDDKRGNIYYVKDNGAGFDMNYYDKLFGVFQRLHSTEDFEGTGIGLATTQRIVSKHGGRLWAEGKVNEGATFYFSLPVSQTPKTNKPAR
ncbi:MAG: PocR ligand-binding domain-containing protein [Smithella sp.]